MFEFSRKEKIVFNNLLSWRNVISVQQVPQVYSEGKQLMLYSNVSKEGPIISCTHGIKRNNMDDIVDFEYMIPISDKIICTAGFYIIDKFSLDSVLICSFTGANSELNLYSSEILEYMKEKRLSQITPVYNILWEESETTDMIKADLCFGVKENGRKNEQE